MEPYWEKDLVINNRELNYKGIFKIEELMSTINRALEAKKYTKREKKTEELVTETGRKTHIEMRPFKEGTSYITLMLKIRINLDNTKETITEFNGFRQKFQVGDVNLIFDAWFLTDYKNRWGMRPFYYFFKGVINKYLFNLKEEHHFHHTLVHDTAYIYAQVKKLFHSYAGDKTKPVSEEEVRAQIEEEIKKERKTVRSK